MLAVPARTSPSTDNDANEVVPSVSYKLREKFAAAALEPPYNITPLTLAGAFSLKYKAYSSGVEPELKVVLALEPGGIQPEMISYDPSSYPNETSGVEADLAQLPVYN